MSDRIASYGFALWHTALTTAKLRAPAASTAGRRCASMPPIATAGCAAAAIILPIVSRPSVGSGISFVGVFLLQDQTAVYVMQIGGESIKLLGSQDSSQIYRIFHIGIVKENIAVSGKAVH